MFDVMLDKNQDIRHMTVETTITIFALESIKQLKNKYLYKKDSK